MSIKIIRVSDGKNSTLSHLYINGIFQCYLLEDKYRTAKIAGKTAIPNGVYQMALNTTCGMHQEYKRRFSAWHEGMIEITGIPNFSLVFFHIGNTNFDTKGCPLAGNYFVEKDLDYTVFNSTMAYKRAYLALLKAMKSGISELVVELADDFFNQNQS